MAREPNLRYPLSSPPGAGIRAPFVKIKKLSTACALAVCLFLPGCHQQQQSAKTETAVFHLFDLFQPDDLKGKIGPDDVGWKRVEWRAQEMA